MQKHLDLLVTNGDFAFEQGGAISIGDRQSIGQDIKHRIIESGLLTQLVGERSHAKQASIINQIIIEVDKDERLDPGTLRILAVGHNTYLLTAKTLEYSSVEVYL